MKALFVLLMLGDLAADVTALTRGNLVIVGELSLSFSLSVTEGPFCFSTTGALMILGCAGGARSEGGGVHPARRSICEGLEGMPGRG